MLPLIVLIVNLIILTGILLVPAVIILVIIPRKLASRNSYYDQVFALLMTPADRTRLGLNGFTALDDANNRWVNGWKVNYPKSINSSTRTKDVIDDRDDDSEYIDGKLHLVFDEIPDSALTNADRNILRLFRRKKGSKRPKITVTPYGKFFNLGGGKIHAVARRNNDNNRPSRHPDSDGVEVAYSVEDVPGTPEQCQHTQFSSKASFEINAGTQFIGKRFSGFVRWKNQTDDTKSGPWSDIISTTLGGSPDA